MYRWAAILVGSIFLLFCLNAAVYSTFFQTSSIKSGKGSTEGKLTEQQAVGGIVKALDYFSTEEGKSIWLSYDPQNRPLIVTFDNGHIYAFNFRSKNPSWETLSIHGKEVLYTTSDLWGLMRIQSQKDFLVDGLPVFVYHLDLVKDNPLDPFITLLHENFMGFEEETFTNQSAERGFYRDHFNLENVVLMQIEEMILADFMNGQLDAVKSHFHKAAALRDFLAVNKIRRKLLKPESWQWELWQQKVEGLAAFVAIKSMDLFPFLDTFDGVKQLLSILQASTVNEEILERTVKWRHHGVGATLGYALDFLQVQHWRERLSSEPLSQLAILEEHILIDDDEIADRMEKIKKRYAYDNVKVQVTLAMQHYEEEVNDLMEEYEDLEGVELNIAKPQHLSLESNGSALYVYYLNDGSTLSLADTSSQNTKNGEWTVELEGAPMVIKKVDGAIMLKLEPETEILVDGKSSSLSEIVSEKREVPFKALCIKSHHCAISSESQSGRLITDNGKVHVKF